jgi:hypothetical protein
MTNGYARLSEAIRAAAEKEGLGIEQFRTRHRLPNASFYGWLRDEEPIPERTKSALRKLRKAGVKHPLLDVL